MSRRSLLALFGVLAVLLLSIAAYWMSVHSTDQGRVTGVDASSSAAERRPAASMLETLPAQERSARQEATSTSVHAAPDPAPLSTGKSRVRGRVIDSNGAAVKEFIVRVEPFVENAKSPVPATIDRAFTDEGGSFDLGGLHEGAWTIRAVAADMTASEPQRVDFPGHDAALVLTVTALASVRGIVLQPDGTPAKDARVEAHFPESVILEPDWTPAPHAEVESHTEVESHSREVKSVLLVIGGKRTDSVTTSSAGRFELRGIPPGVLALSATAETWGRSTQLILDVRPGDRIDDVTLSLRPSGRIAGLVLDRAGQPDAGRTVSTCVFELGGEWSTAVSDADGRFTFERLAPAEYYLHTLVKDEEWAVAAGDATVRHRLDQQRLSARAKVVAGNTTEVTMGGVPDGALHLVGRVTSAGGIVAGCDLSAFKQGNLEGGSEQSHSSATTLSDGSYDLTLDGEGSYIIYVRPLRASTCHTFELKLGPDLRQSRDFEIPGGRIAGRAVDRAGRPQARVELRLLGEPRVRTVVGRTTEGDAETDAAGNFAFESVAPGNYEITCGGYETEEDARFGGRARLGPLKLVAGSPLEGLVFVLQPACRVEGLVTGTDGKPVAGAHVYAVDEQGKHCTLCDDTETDSAGRFLFLTLAPVRIAFAAVKDGQASPLSSFVQVREDRTVKVELALAKSTVLFAEVVDGEGRPIDADIQVSDAEKRVLTYCRCGKSTDESLPGERFGPLAPGKYAVLATCKDKPAVRLDVSVAGEETKAVRVRCD